MGFRVRRGTGLERSPRTDALTTICIWEFDRASSRRDLGRNVLLPRSASSLWAGIALGLALAVAALPARAQEIVHFPSLDAGRTPLDGYFFPAGDGGRHPAVVGVHGCSGMLLPNGTILPSEFAWAYLLRSRGWSVLLVDSFGPRQHGEMCSVTGFNLAIYHDRPKDAYGALAWLQARDDVRGDRVGVLGWSQGGGVVLLSVGEPSLGRPNPLTQADFRAAVAFYPASCSDNRLPSGWTTKTPLFVLQGEADVWTPAAACAAAMGEAAARGAAVTMQLYPGAYHAFDAPNLPRRELPKYVTRAGVVPIIATDPAARDDAMRRVPAFFARYFTD